MENSVNFNPLYPQKHGDFESQKVPLFYINMEKALFRKPYLHTLISMSVHKHISHEYSIIPHNNK